MSSTVWTSACRCPRDAAAARLVERAQCLYGEGWVAHALYRVDGEPVSMFVHAAPDRSDAGRRSPAFGRHAQVRDARCVTYVLVSPARLSAVARRRRS